jgi:ABC-type glycerol-3-phosphate transport system substrate-binding protein
MPIMRLRHILYLIAGALFLTLVAGCAKKPSNEIGILIRMMPAQERFFREQIIPEFEKQYNCKVNINTFTNEWDIERLLDLEKSKKVKSIALVKTPFELTRVLVDKGYIADLYSVQDSDKVNQDLAEYHPLASGLGYIDSKPYFLPRKLETRTLFYLKSKVADAVSKFDKHKKRINTELKALNNFGLPAEYTLESDPSEWDFYDIYVVGSIWANEEYNGVKLGRIAHRGARYGGTALDLVDKALQLGATKDDILRLTSDKVVETFIWERALIKSNIYNPGMWQDQWKGTNIYSAIKDGKVFLSILQQIDEFTIHGWKDDPSMPSYLPNEEDMGLAVMPKAVSFTLDDKGKYAFEGTRAISTGGWWWGIPQSAPNAKLAYDLARFITNRENQAKECSRFGMIPVRKDIVNNLSQVFDQGWVGEIYKTSVDQILANGLTTVPLVKSYTELGQNLIDAWYGLGVEYKEVKGETENFADIKLKLASEYLTKQKELLKNDYPDK